MKKILLPLLLLCCFAAQAQLNNSWIDYNKTYYKFKVSATGLYQLPQATLATAGLGATNADHFQIWRNGVQVRLHTTTTGAPLAPSGYIEFYAKANDGKADTKLYRNPDFQLSDKYSLYSDTAAFFLTVNPAGGNLRFNTLANPQTGPSVPDAYFMREVVIDFKDKVNPGYADFAGELVYSSSYDEGEGWTSPDIYPADNFTKTFSSLNVYTAGPSLGLTVKANVSGNANNFRNLKISFNGDSIYGASLLRYTSRKVVVADLDISRFTNPNSATVKVEAVYPNLNTTDRLVVGALGFIYPATFNFNNQKVFEFKLDASGAGRNLVIDNFNTGGVAPLLLDFATGLRMIGDITSIPGKVKFVLGSSSIPRDCLLVSQESSNISFVPFVTAKTFLNITQIANQGDYLIISNPALYNDGNGANYVDQYKQYRASANGGSFNVKIYDINELYDQFSFGIPAHPSAIRDFIINASDNWSTRPKNVFLIGRGISYNNRAGNVLTPAYNKLDLVPSFGWPASDILLASRPGTIDPVIPIGRLSAVNGLEVKTYLNKMVEYETEARNQSCNIADKQWMKNVMHVAGGKNAQESALFEQYMFGFAGIAKAPFFGAHVELFQKSSSATVEQANSQRIIDYINEGVAVINYFGHSSTNTFEYNLSNPADYQNQGKYPFFTANGCNAGDFFRFDPDRLTGSYTLSEKYMLTPNRGSIGFLASTHFGIPDNLNTYITRLYQEFSFNQYGKSVGEQIKKVVQTLGGSNPNLDFRTRIHIEENTLHGDPALKIYSFSKPDYAIEASSVKISPNQITVADNNFNVSIQYRNIGRATNDSIRINVRRQLPDNSFFTVYNSKRLAAYNIDSLNFTLQINPTLDKGLNKIIVTLDSDNAVSELCETNNSVTKEFYIFEDELRPVYPYNFSIVNTNAIKYAASTANPLSGVRTYNMEIDTTELFNSSFKKSYTTSGVGGVVEFTPTNINYTDSTVYYWRTSIAPVGAGTLIWQSSSFIYLPNSTPGFNQSHYYQFLRSTYSDLTLNANRKFEFTTAPQNITIRTGLYPYYDFDKINVNVGVTMQEYYGCRYNSLQFYVFDPATLKLWDNQNVGGSGSYNSESICDAPQRKFFEYRYNTTTARRKAAMDFLDLIPAGMYVGITNLGFENTNNTFINSWQNDTLTLGSGNSLYHKLKSIGFSKIDSFYRNIPFMYFFQKGNNNYTPVQAVGSQANSYIDQTMTVISSRVEGFLESPVYGPAKQWQELHWRGTTGDPAPFTDTVKVDVYGIDNSGIKTYLRTINPAQDTTLNFVNATVYPYLQLRFNTKDTFYVTPMQLRYLRVNASLVAEGAIAPNIAFNAPDTVAAGQEYIFSLAFKNVSPVAFDSMLKVKFIITDRNNVPHVVNIPQRKALVSGDTLMITYALPTISYPGANTIFVDVNPDNHQPEQYHFNNVLYKDFFVKADIFNPTLDVTFDAVHILNRDIVAAQPNILIKLKDENRFVALADTALLKVQIRYPDNTLRTLRFDNDTMRFFPATSASSDNTARIELKPFLKQDGEYQLIVSGKDANGNKAGDFEYKILFNVINKAMISNLLNYPNPFTSSTAFVFTLTGSEIPQNMRIQILTITGKVVKEITMAELGNVHIGRNITDYKWDGTDMYNQKLANGVYLYRVITNLNGKSLDQYKAEGDNTDKYFNKGYGKMYLMR